MGGPVVVLPLKSDGKPVGARPCPELRSPRIGGFRSALKPQRLVRAVLVGSDVFIGVGRNGLQYFFQGVNAVFPLHTSL